MTLPPETRVLPGPHRGDDDRPRVGGEPVRHLLARRVGVDRRGGPRRRRRRRRSSSGRPTTTARARRWCASPTGARRSSAARVSSDELHRRRGDRGVRGGAHDAARSAARGARRGDQRDDERAADADRADRGPVPRAARLRDSARRACSRSDLHRLLGALDGRRAAGGRPHRHAATSSRSMRRSRSGTSTGARTADRITLHLGPALETIASSRASSTSSSSTPTRRTTTTTTRRCCLG